MTSTNRPFFRALLIAATYAVIGAVWIAFSDRLVEAVADGPAMLTRLQTLKGWAFVALSAGLILAMTTQAIRRERNLSRDALAEKEVLLGEIHHRVRNNLQMIISLLSLETAKLTDPAARGALDDALGRVQAIGLVHHHLYESGNFRRIEFGAYAKDLCRAVVQTASGEVALAFDLQPLECDPDRIIPLGMILVELTTNAVKHGFPGGRAGTITIRLGRQDGKCMALEVEDDGIGLVDSHAQGTTSGLALVRMMTRQLNGRLIQSAPPGGGALFRVELDSDEIRPRPGPL